jgi:OFA family oxalate/formate antiporter-like MFS transporter
MAAGRNLKSYRWVQLVLGVICMVMIANYQYGWTFFVVPLQKTFKWSREDIQTAFTIFVVFETWLVPLEGYLVDRLGPRLVVVGGGLLVGIAWALNSTASSLTMLYVGQAIAGIGAGAVYGTCVGTALKWFPDRRGLAAGLTAAGFGMGSALTVLPITWYMDAHGYASTFLAFGLGQGLIVFILGWLLRQPGPDDLGLLPPPSARVVAKRDFRPMEMVRTPVFWVMYVMFVLMAAGGLMVTANLVPIAKDFKVADIPVTAPFGWVITVQSFALIFDRVLNGVTRPFFGWVSDRLGRENTMLLAFGLEGCGIFLLSQNLHSPAMFIVLSGLVFFAWGEIYSLFPSTCGDSYGSKFAAANAGLLYTAKGTAALLIPKASVLSDKLGWPTVFIAAGVMNIAAALLAVFVLKPLRQRLSLSQPRTVALAEPALETKPQ